MISFEEFDWKNFYKYLNKLFLGIHQTLEEIMMILGCLWILTLLVTLLLGDLTNIYKYMHPCVLVFQEA